MPLFQKPSRDVDRVFLHCSASDNPAHDDVEVMRDWHVNGNGWSDVGYHFFIKKDGTVQPGRPLSRTPAAQAPYNSGTIAICCHGLKEEKFTRAQYEAVIALCKEIDQAYGHEVSFHGHCEVSPKSCPVYPYKTVLGLDENGAMRFNPNPTPSIEAAPPPATDLPTLRVTSKGFAVRVLQQRLGAKGYDVGVDGIFGQQTLAAVKAFQEANGLGIDGVVGPNTWDALEA
jgi:N-acetyl-anhydromuramyl-L-alanine amidase AmpD